jgi:hypothetical protein
MKEILGDVKTVPGPIMTDSHSTDLTLVIIGEYAVDLICDGNIAPTIVERFVHLFQETFQRLPAEVQQRIKRHWCSFAGCEYNDRPPMVKITLTAYPVGPPEVDSVKQARCTSEGHALYFWAPAVKAYPDQSVQATIAHELAHVYHYATGQINDDQPGRAENMAMQTQDEWGFDYKEDERIEATYLEVGHRLCKEACDLWKSQPADQRYR